MRCLVRALAVVALALPAAPVALAAQGIDAGSPYAPDPVFQRAEELVLGGNGADGRAIVDSVLATARPGSVEYGEALYWRAALAETAAEAERSYLRLTIEYPLHPRTEQALIRLAQLEQTRGNRMLAVSRLQRAVLDFPASPERARTQFRMARLYLDEKRVVEGCGALEEARRLAEDGDVELRNQVDYMLRGCAGVNVAAQPTAPTAPRAAQGAEAPAPARPAPARPVPPRPAEARPSADTHPTAPAAAHPSAPATAATAAATHAPSRPAAEPRPAPTRPAAAPARGNFSVQVAAFDRVAPAEALVADLREKGIDARIDADEQWNRVRIGYFATREEAAALAKRLKEDGITGFVTGIGR